jgi:hypothetical protein
VGRGTVGLNFAAVIDSTLMVFVFASSAPTTVTFCPANFSGSFFWSLSTYALLPS